MPQFETQLIVDADMTDHGWEIAVRFGADDMEAAFTGVSDEALPDCIGQTMAATLIDARDHFPDETRREN